MPRAAPPGMKRRTPSARLCPCGASAAGRVGCGAASPFSTLARTPSWHHRLSLPAGKHAYHTLEKEGVRLARRPKEAEMDVVYERCCGLDIHKRTVVACLLVPSPDGPPVQEIRTFGTMTDELRALAGWLGESGCTHVAMESTGVYWKPVWNLLEDQFTLLLVNARHVKAVPGRQTDVKDAAWLAELLRHGLLRSSVVPDRAQRELQELTRYRTSLVQERTAEVNRLQKTLEGANLKVAAVATDILGVSGRQMLRAIVAGETDAAVLAELAKGRLRDKRPALERALQGQIGAHQRFLLGQQLAHIEQLEATIAAVSAEIAERLRPFAVEQERLETIPGVGPRTAQVLLAELGPDVSRFPSAGHLASWAGMCPGNDESAGCPLGDTAQRKHTPGQSLAALSIDRGRPCRCTLQTDLSGRPVSPPRDPAGQ